jgi:hypothetical protein
MNGGLPAHLAPVAKLPETPGFELRRDVSFARPGSKERFEIPDALIFGS